MKNKFRPIAMKCNQEQFDSIESKLKNMKVNYNLIFDDESYLVNCFRTEFITTCKNTFFNSMNILEIHETWNEKVFLEACGIEVEESFSITKDQILHVEKTSPYSVSKELKQWFPKAFEEEKKELIAGKWYKIKDNNDYLLLYSGKDKSFGFYLNNWGSWSFSKGSNQELAIEATEQEVFEALKKEAVNRGYVDGMYVKPLWGTPYKSWNLTGHDFLFRDGNLYLSSCIFKDGIWASIIQTITKEAAEKQLGKKII